MPSTRHWSVPQRRIIASVVLVVVGVFLVCGGVGMQKWLVGGIGGALIAVGALLFILSAINSRATSEVQGIAHVIDRTSPPAGVTRGRCRLHLVVSARGIDDVSVRIRDSAVPVAKWPDRGATLPVMISIDNPQKVYVLWDRVRTHSQVAMERDRIRATGAAFVDEDFVDDADIEDLGFPPTPGASRVHAPTTSRTDGVDADWADDEGRDVDDSVLIDAGVRVIELDVMDPSVMRWSSAPPPSASGGTGASVASVMTEAVAASGDSAAAASGPPSASSATTPSSRPPAARPPGTRPSPRPRKQRGPGGQPPSERAPGTGEGTRAGRPPASDDGTTPAKAAERGQAPRRDPPEWPLRKPSTSAAASRPDPWGEPRDERTHRAESIADGPNVPQQRPRTEFEVDDGGDADGPY